jgi:hypothetical protein
MKGTNKASLSIGTSTPPTTGDETVRVKPVVLDNPPPVPIIVVLKVPVVADELAANLTVEEQVG